MASYTALFAKHATLTAATVDTVTFGREAESIEVQNRGASDIYFRTDGGTPTVGGDDTYVVVPSTVRKVPNGGLSDASTVVKLISSGAIAYSATAL